MNREKHVQKQLRRVLVCMAAVAHVGIAADAGRAAALFDPADAKSPKATITNGRSELIKDGDARRLKLLASGRDDVELSIAPASGVWDLSGSSAVRFTLRNPGDAPITVRCRVENADAKGLMNACRNAVELMPGEQRQFDMRLTRRPQDPTFEPFRQFYMYVKAINVRDNTIDPSAVARVVVSAARGIEISTIEPIGDAAPADPAFLPFIDQYGQYTHSDWPGKIYSDADFATRRQAEEKEQSDWPHPKEWDKYGGWVTGPTLKATGYFYAAKHEGKWWLVDPDGKLFWSYGPTGVGFGGDVTPVNDRENWFTELPPADGPLGRFYRDGRGAMFKYYQSKPWHGFDIQQANLFRKYGADYQNACAQISHDRLHSWGFNTIGNWSAPTVYLLHRTPYTVAINSPSVSIMKGGDGHSFQDVFDERWEPGLIAELEKQRGKTAGDPWCLGYFVDNERAIGWRVRGASIGEMALKADAKQPAKLKFIELLTAKYKSVDALNKSWGSSYASWDALRDSRDPPALKGNDPLINDCGDLGMAFCERYFSVSRDAVKRVAPNNMFLGTRFYGHTDPQIVALAAKYEDVISYNIYDNPPDGRVNQYAKIDKPILCTEWGIESDPMQTPFRDEKLTAPTPAERAAKVSGYVEHALRLPNLVGAHFFQFRDQPISGRSDGEATLRGFVNVADTPNFELVQANRRVTYTMYETRANAK